MIGQILEYNTAATKAEFLFMIQSVNLPPSAHTITFSVHCSSHYIFSAHCSQLQPSTTTYTAAILSRAHCSYYIQCTLQLYYSVHTAATLSIQYIQYTFEHLQCIHCSSHYIFSAHFSHVQPCTAIYSQSSVHTAANCSHLQPPTLQLYYPVHTTAILFSAHCRYTIYTVNPVHL